LAQVRRRSFILCYQIFFSFIDVFLCNKYHSAYLLPRLCCCWVDSVLLPWCPEFPGSRLQEARNLWTVKVSQNTEQSLCRLTPHQSPCLTKHSKLNNHTFFATGKSTEATTIPKNSFLWNCAVQSTNKNIENVQPGEEGFCCSICKSKRLARKMSLMNTYLYSMLAGSTTNSLQKSKSKSRPQFVWNGHTVYSSESLHCISNQSYRFHIFSNQIGKRGSHQ
jgi:hypothetical protein